MRVFLAVAILMGILGGRAAVADDGKPPSAKNIMINLRVCSGDPIGKKEKGTLKVSAEPRLATREMDACSFFSGGEAAVSNGAGGVEFVEIGRKVVIKTGVVRGNMIHLDISYFFSFADDPTSEPLRIRSEATRTVGTFKLGEVIKLPLSPRPADKQEWIEVVANEVDPKSRTVTVHSERIRFR